MRTLKILGLVILLGLLAPRAESPFCAGALHAQQRPPAQPMPEPGNPGHVQPHKDAFCDRSTHPARACKCHAKCIVDDKGKIVEIQEDPKCRAHCFRDHCRCPADCE